MLGQSLLLSLAPAPTVTFLTVGLPAGWDQTCDLQHLLLLFIIKRKLEHLPLNGWVAEEMIFELILNNEQEHGGRETKEKGPKVMEEEEEDEKEETPGKD